MMFSILKYALKFRTKLADFFFGLSESFSDLASKFVLSSRAIQVFFYSVFAVIVVASWFDGLQLIRSLCTLVLVFVAALFLGAGLRNVIETHSLCNKMEKLVDGDVKYSVFDEIPIYLTVGGKEETVNPCTVSVGDSGAGGFEYVEPENEVNLGVVDFGWTLLGKTNEDEWNRKYEEWKKEQEKEWEWINDGLSGIIAGGSQANFQG